MKEDDEKNDEAKRRPTLDDPDELMKMLAKRQRDEEMGFARVEEQHDIASPIVRQGDVRASVARQGEVRGGVAGAQCGHEIDPKAGR